MKKTKLYLLDPKMKWSVFKKLHDKIVVDSGPTPQNFTKILWQMLRDKQIYCGYTDYMSNDMWIGLKIPKDWEVELITNAKI